MKDDDLNVILLESFLSASTEHVEAALRRLVEQRRGTATLSVDLAQDLQMPIEASVLVPVEVTFVAVADKIFHVTIRAKSREGDYPKFHGQLTVLESGNGSKFELRGRYSAPFGALGDFVDLTFMRDVAQASLQRFLDDLARETLVLIALPPNANLEHP